MQYIDRICRTRPKTLKLVVALEIISPIHMMNGEKCACEYATGFMNLVSCNLSTEIKCMAKKEFDLAPNVSIATAPTKESAVEMHLHMFIGLSISG